MKKYLLEHKWLTLFSFLLYAVQIAFQLSASLFMMRLLGVAIAGDLRGVAIIIIIHSLIWVAFGIFERWSNIMKAKALAAMNNSLRRDISRAIAEQDFQSFGQKDLGSYLSLYTNDVNQAENLGFHTFYNYTRLAIRGTLSTITLLSIHWFLAVLTALNLLYTLKLSAVLSKSTEKKSGIVSQAMEKFTGAIKDQLGGFPTLKIFGFIQNFTKHTGEASKALEETKYQFAKSRDNVSFTVAVSNLIPQTLVTWSMYYMAITGIVDFGVIFGGGNIQSMAFNSILELAQMQVTLTSSKPYFDKLAYTPPKEQELPPLRPSTQSINLHKISYAYTDKPVLQDVDMTFEIGKKYALVGPSGCGKTTILRLLLGHLENYQGALNFDEQNAKEFSVQSRYSQIAYISQETYLFNTTIRDNITLERDFPQEALNRALSDSALLHDLETMPKGLDTIVGEDGRNLSGGQRQRICIARALLHKRSILLVDEGTSALDQKNADIVEDSLLKNKELTLILVSHHLSEHKKAMFDKVYEMSPIKNS